MKDELFDSKIKELVDSCAETPSPEVWDRIEAGLDRGLRLRRAWRRVAYWSSAAAVAVGLSAVALMRQPDVPARHQEADVLAEVTAPKDSAPESEVLAAEVPAMERQPLQSVPVIKSGVVKQNPSSLPSVTAVRQRKVLSEPETLSEQGAARIPSILLFLGCVWNFRVQGYCAGLRAQALFPCIGWPRTQIFFSQRQAGSRSRT